MKNRGFTLVEILVVIVILALLSGIAIFTVNNITKKTEENYYISSETTLKMAGNDYFSDNRADRPIDDYNFVSLDSLVEHEYLEQLKTYDKKANCSNQSGVYIYNTDEGTEYEVCLICGTYKSQGPYCKGEMSGQIMITGEANGQPYNPLLSYAGTPWASAGSVKITFKIMDTDKGVSKFEVYNGNTDTAFSTCVSSNNKSCTLTMSVTGSYYAIAYDGSQKVANKKYFNVKIDNTAPTFEFKDKETVKYLNEGYEYEYKNEIINIHDDNGYKSVVYSLKDLVNDRMIVNSQDITESNLEFENILPSGNYQLSATVTDYAKNASEPKTLNFEVRYNVNLIFFDNNEKKYDIGTFSVYKGGKYEGLPRDIKVGTKIYTVDWYDNTNYTGTVYNKDSIVSKSNTHNLYGRELREKILLADYPECNNGGEFTYNGENQVLASAKTGYKLTNNIHKDAGTYTVIAIPEANYTWEDGSRTYKIFQCTIKPYTTTFDPSVNPCVEGLVYNASYQYIVDMRPAAIMDTVLSHLVNFNGKKEVGFSASPVYEKDAGSYVVTYSLNPNKNFVWADGTSDDKQYTCKIGPYPAKFPDECEIYYGGLTNVGGHSLGVNYEQFSGEMRTIFAKGKYIKSGSDMIYVSEVYWGNYDAPRSKFKLSNYYIAEPEIDCAIIPTGTTIIADSDKKLYDGTALTNDGYTERVGVTSALGDTITSVTVTGTQTEVGSSDNVPSAAVIKNGSKDVTKYYSITYTNGKLEVYDDVKPTCSLSIDEDGKITASPDDNYKLAYYGFSSSYSGTNSTETTVSSAGSKTYYVKDTSGNKNTCKITYEKVKQKRETTCKKHEECADSSCGTCGGGCKSWNYTGTCTCTEGSGDIARDCTHSTCRSTCLSVNSTGVYSYSGTCERDTCNSYYDTYDCSCENDNCKCKDWNDPGGWEDDKKCKKSTTEKKIVECRTIYRAK